MYIRIYMVLYEHYAYVCSIITANTQFETHEADVSMGGCELYMFNKPSPSSFFQKWYSYCFHTVVDVMQQTTYMSYQKAQFALVVLSVCSL